MDGELIVEQPIESYKAGRFLRVPMIVGSNAREGSLFLNGATAFGDGASLMAALTRTYGDAAARIAAQYPVAKYSSANEAAIDLTGDSVFVCSAHTTAQLLSRHTDVFVYNWTRAVGVPPYSSYGATHAVELAWVWDWWRPELLGAPANESMLATQVADYWTRLAEFGDPNGEGLPTWPRYDASSDPELTLDLEIRTTQGRRAERCALWNDVRVGLWGDAWNLAR